MQDGAAFEMSAAIDQRDVIPKRQRVSVPKFDPRTLTHDPLSILRVQKNLRIEALCPFHHCRIIMGMRNRDGTEAAA